MAIRPLKGDAKIRRGTATASTAVAPYDLLYQDATTKKLLPADSYTWDTNIATTQGTFKDQFAGIATQQRLAAQTDTPDMPLATGGVFLCDCAALGAASPAGTYWGPAKQSGNLLEPQKMVVVANATLAIARQVEDAASGATQVVLEFTSSIYADGVQTIT